MLGIDYRSDSEDEVNDIAKSSSAPTNISPASGTTSGSSNKLFLPPPAKSSAMPSKSLALPPPKAKKATGPKKIIVELPKLDKHASDDELTDDMPAAKKPRLGGMKASGASALLSMLPAPKKTKIDQPAPQRVLGGGRPGIMYSAASQSKTREEVHVVEDTADNDDVAPEPVVDTDTTTSMIPPSMLLKGKLKTHQSVVPKPPSHTIAESSTSADDFFSLGHASSSRIFAAPSISDPSGTPRSVPQNISAAPKIEEFCPPSPKIEDPYPGYYQLPSGQWAMHDPAYYKAYSDRWAKEYEAQIRAFERGQKGFEGAGVNGEDATEVSAEALSDAARAAREEKKALTQRAGRDVDRPVPKVALNPTKMGGVARSRHQLHSLLADAFLNREQLEERIAQGKRNRKEAGNKYGF